MVLITSSVCPVVGEADRSWKNCILLWCAGLSKTLIHLSDEWGCPPSLSVGCPELVQPGSLRAPWWCYWWLPRGLTHQRTPPRPAAAAASHPL